MHGSRRTVAVIGWISGSAQIAQMWYAQGLAIPRCSGASKFQKACNLDPAEQRNKRPREA